jgi:hypothetical protein
MADVADAFLAHAAYIWCYTPYPGTNNNYSQGTAVSCGRPKVFLAVTPSLSYQLIMVNGV